MAAAPPAPVRTPARASAACVLAALATLAIAGTVAAEYGDDARASPRNARRAEGAPPPPKREPGVKLADTGQASPFSFLENLFGGPPPSTPPRSPMVRRRSPQPELRRRRTRVPSASRRSERSGRSDDAGTYRTMCVRLCDGYYWPISFATDRRNFRRDSKVCAKSCGSPAALYYYPNPGGEPDDMVSLDGHPYKSLGTAFLYRATYDASCKCRPHPWEAEAIERHRRYAQPKQARAAAQRSRRSR